MTVRSVIAVVLFLIPIVWASILVGLSVTRAMPSTSLFSAITKPSADDQKAALQHAQESAQRTRDKVIRLWPLAAAYFVAAVILLATSG